MKFFSFKQLIIVALIFFGVLSGVRGFETQSVEASSNTQLEFRVRQLESQLSRLESQFNRLSTASSTSPIIQVEPDEVESNTIESEGRQNWVSGDPMFDRLATLVIELKQEVQDLQQRMQQLESGR